MGSESLAQQMAQSIFQVGKVEAVGQEKGVREKGVRVRKRVSGTVFLSTRTVPDALFWLSAVRYRIETSNGQLAERYEIKRTWAKDLWHLCHRVIRKILSHTAAVFVNLRTGNPALQLDALAA